MNAQFYKHATLPIAVIVLSFSTARGGTHPHCSLSAMIALSKTIVTGKVIAIESIPDRIQVRSWRPNCRVTIQVTNVMRGRPGKVLTAKTFLEKESPIVVNSEVILFVCDQNEKGEADVFPAAQGLMSLKRISQAGRDEESNKVIRKAIFAAIADSKTSAELGPKALSHFINIANHDNPHIREFTMRFFLDTKKEEAIGKELIRALSDKEESIRTLAAWVLTLCEYKESAAEIAVFAATLPENDLRKSCLEFLSKSDAEKYDFKAKVLLLLDKMDPYPHSIFANTLHEHRDSGVWIRFRVDKDAKTHITRTAAYINKDELAKFTLAMEKWDIRFPHLIPFDCEISIAYNNGKQSLHVSVY